MKNDELNNQPERDEIPNLEQFQVHRTDTHPGEPKDEVPTDPGESEYTEDEIPFADGEGTLLDEEIDDDIEVEDDKDSNLDAYK